MTTEAKLKYIELRLSNLKNCGYNMKNKWPLYNDSTIEKPGTPNKREGSVLISTWAEKQKEEIKALQRPCLAKPWPLLASALAFCLRGS